MSDYTNNTVMDGGSVDSTSKMWRPMREVVSVDTTVDTITSLQKKVRDLGVTVEAFTTDTPEVATTVLHVSGVSATESPFKTTGGQMVSLVAVNFTPNAGDPNFAGVEVWFTNYNGSANPQLVAEGRTSPLQFLCDTTLETVTVTVIAYHADGSTADATTAPTTTVLLDGVVSAPPAPSISQFVVGTSSGYQFAFNQIALPAGTQDAIDAYRVYRNTVNNSATATLLYPLKHDATATGAVVVIDPAPNAQTFYYWVSAVNKVGLESALTAAQVTAATTVTPVDASGNVILKNVAQAPGTTSGGTSSSTSYSVIPDMSVTVTTKGNRVLIAFSGICTGDVNHMFFFALFKDGTQLTPDYQFGANSTFTAALTWLDSPTAASHTYDMRYKTGNASFPVGVSGTSRALQLVELG